MDAYKIAVLSEDVAAARLRLQVLGMQNIAGLEPANLVISEAKYNLARAALIAAETELAAAMRE